MSSQLKNRKTTLCSGEGLASTAVAAAGTQAECRRYENPQNNPPALAAAPKSEKQPSAALLASHQNLQNNPLPRPGLARSESVKQPSARLEGDDEVVLILAHQGSPCPVMPRWKPIAARGIEQS
jgi:hypothetical protein